MVRVLAIDPGTKTTGWCIVEKDGKEQTIVSFGFVRPETVVGEDCTVAYERAMSVMDALAAELESADLVVIEQPHHHRNTPNHESIRVLVQFVQALYTALLLLHSDIMVKTYYPKQWKGTVKKEVTQNRIKLVLSESHQEVLDSYPKAMQHDVYDAIGIALYETRNKWKRKSKH